MKARHWLWLTVLVFSLGLIGCKEAPSEKPKAPGHPAEQQTAEDKVKTNLAKLDAADRKLAEAQQFCAVENENRLGSMGVPVKIMVKDQPVFLCCGGCRKTALADADKTLAKVEELKKKSAASAPK